MQYRQMQTFLEVAGCLSFTTAAKNLGLTQQAVTRQIAALEDDIRIPLFYRTTREVALTPAGRMLRNDFSKIHIQIKKSIVNAQAIGKGKDSYLNVGILSILPRQKVVIPIVQFLLKEFPDVQFEIQLLDFIELRNEILDGNLDFCIITSADWSVWPGIRSEVLSKNVFEVVYSKDHPLASLERFDTEKLEDFSQLVLPDEIHIGGIPFWRKLLPSKDVSIFPDIATLLVHLETGEGYAILTRMFEGSDSPNLCFRPLEYLNAYAELVCISRTNAADEVALIMRSIKGFYTNQKQE